MLNPLAAYYRAARFSLRDNITMLLCQLMPQLACLRNNYEHDIAFKYLACKLHFATLGHLICRKYVMAINLMAG